MTEREPTKCCDCDRGGNGNAKDKCSCGWKVATDNGLSCYLGVPIVGPRKVHPRKARSKARYQEYLRVSDCFDSFSDYLKYGKKTT